ncbi:MAG TPA: hypothetical protein VHC21_02545 [Candidatus Saccharimonadales bacterium]|nr:hypothetical protein [Candidatus Saccharimonadales bacterium]
MHFPETNGRTTEENFKLLCPDILTTKEVADYCGANPRTVTKWVENKPNIKKLKHQKKINELAAVVALLETELSYDAEGIRSYLMTPHIDADSYETRTMLDVLKNEKDGIPLAVSYAIEQCVDIEASSVEAGDTVSVVTYSIRGSAA